MPTHTLGHLEFSVNEPQTSDVEEKMADTMLRVTAVTLLMTSSVVHSDIVPQGHCLGAILLKYSKLEQFLLSSLIICEIRSHLWNVPCFCRSSNIWAQQFSPVMHSPQQLLISWFWWIMNKFRVYSQNKNDKISQKPETSKTCFGSNFFVGSDKRAAAKPLLSMTVTWS